MNLNNKKLAVGLSIAAVVVVAYQVFINKPNQPAMNRPQAEPVVSTSTHTGGENMPGSSPHPQAVENVEIDFNSQALLKRISPESTVPYPRNDIPSEFGAKIFTIPGTPKEKIKLPEGEKEIEFKLNAIIIDEKRKIAIINDKILKVGDFIEGAQVQAIVRREVLLKLDDREIVLSTSSKIKKIKLIGGKGAK